MAVAQLATKDWPQFGRTSNFQSFKDVGPKASPEHDEWTFTAGSRVVASPAVVNGLVYAGSDDGTIFALNATTGKQVWSYKTGGPVRSSPAVLANGSVVAGSYDGSIYHISATGSVLATFKTGSGVYAPASVHGNTVYIGSFDQHTYALELPSLRMKWSFEGTSVMNAGVAVSADGNRAFTMDYHGIVYCLNTADGSEVWRASTGQSGGGGSTPVLDGQGRVFAGSWSQTVRALNESTGEALWVFQTHGEVESHTAWHDNVLYVSAEESKAVFAIDATNGSQLWAWEGIAGEELNGSPSLTPGLLYVGANDHQLYCLNRSTGSKLFSVPAQANVFASAAIADDGWVYFADNTATLSEIKQQHRSMADAWKACGSDAACAAARMQAVWEERTPSELAADANPVGHVYAVNPSKHL